MSGLQRKSKFFLHEIFFKKMGLVLLGSDKCFRFNWVSLQCVKKKTSKINVIKAKNGIEMP